MVANHVPTSIRARLGSVLAFGILLGVLSACGWKDEPDYRHKVLNKDELTESLLAANVTDLTTVFNRLRQAAWSEGLWPEHLYEVESLRNGPEDYLARLTNEPESFPGMLGVIFPGSLGITLPGVWGAAFPGMLSTSFPAPGSQELSTPARRYMTRKRFGGLQEPAPSAEGEGAGSATDGPATDGSAGGEGMPSKASVNGRVASILANLTPEVLFAEDDLFGYRGWIWFEQIDMQRGSLPVYVERLAYDAKSCYGYDRCIAVLDTPHAFATTFSNEAPPAIAETLLYFELTVPPEALDAMVALENKKTLATIIARKGSITQYGGPVRLRRMLAPLYKNYLVFRLVSPEVYLLFEVDGKEQYICLSDNEHCAAPVS